MSKSDAVKQVIHYRKLQQINHAELRRDLQQSPVVTHPDDPLTALVEQYNSDLSQLLETHAPLRSRILTVRPFSPWYDDELICQTEET